MKFISLMTINLNEIYKETWHKFMKPYDSKCKLTLFRYRNCFQSAKLFTRYRRVSRSSDRIINHLNLINCRY